MGVDSTSDASEPLSARLNTTTDKAIDEEEPIETCKLLILVVEPKGFEPSTS